MRPRARVPVIAQKKLVFPLLLVLLLSLSESQARLVLVFRYDDLAAQYPGETGAAYEARRAVDREVLESFRQAGLPVTLAVQPFSASGTPGYGLPAEVSEADTAGCLRSDTGAWLRPLSADSELVQWLKEASADGVAEIAQHGFSHENLALALRPSEFAGLPQAWQSWRIERGRELLAEWLGESPAVFVPPFNTCDEATLRLLREHGLEVLSADSRAPRGEPGLSYVPQNRSTLRGVRYALRHWRQGPRLRIVVWMMHPYDFTRDPGLLAELRALLAEVKDDPQVEVLTVGQCAERYAEHLPQAAWLKTTQGWDIVREQAKRWAFYHPLATWLLGVLAPLLVSAGLWGIVWRVSGAGRPNADAGARMWPFKVLAVLALLLLLGQAYRWVSGYHSQYAFREEFPLLIYLTFLLDSVRRLGNLRRARRPSANTPE